MLQQPRIFFNSPFMLCISIGLLLFRVVVSQIALGSKLSVVDNDLWLSSNGDFALGFFNRSDQPKQFSVGIRFNSRSIPVDKQTVVWVAGADAAVGNGSYFQLTQDGKLLLFDGSQGVTVWTTKTSHLSVASAALGDGGNLVLLNDKKDIVWQSFDTPSDTLLPGQKLSAFRTLRATSTNPLSSYYSLYLNGFGQLQLNWESSVNYWNGGGPSHTNVSAVLTSNGTLQIVDQKLEPLWSVFGQDHDDTVKFRFLRLDMDGNLRMYSWLEVSQSWRSVWQAVENQCNVFATCGERGICLYNASGSPNCKCPFKYTSTSNSKCLLRYQQGCNSGSTWIVFEHIALYGMYPANDSFSQSSLQQCKDMCLHEPHCTAVTFRNNRTAECRMMTTQYVTGISDPSLSSVSFIKKCSYSDPLAADPSFQINSKLISPLKRSYRPCVPCLTGAASGTIFVFIVIQLVIAAFLYRKRKLIWRKAALTFAGPKLKGLIILSFCEIKELSGNFEYQMGPKMFKGMLPDNQPVVIKELDANIEDRKFRSAALKIGNIHHKDLVKLEGYCCEFSHRYLVYEFAKSGSVGKYIGDSKLCKKLTWKKRVDICLSVARALCYLHTECREFMSHGNLKCEHVVLDENLVAKVTEFGLGIFQGEASFYDTSAEKDVEDFGKMVLILVSGRREVEDFCLWAYNEWMEGRPEAVVDKRIDGRVDPEELERMLRIAYWCLQTDERLRPSVGEILNVLEGTLTVDPAPSPFVGRRLEDEESSKSSLESYYPTEH